MSLLFVYIIINKIIRESTLNNVRHRTGAGFAYQRGLYGFGIGIAF